MSEHDDAPEVDPPRPRHREPRQSEVHRDPAFAFGPEALARWREEEESDG